MRQRLKNDFQFAMIVAFGVLASIAISGFAVFRFLTGNLFGALINLTIVVLVLAVLSYATWTGRSGRAGILFAIVTALGAFSSTLVFGATGLSWSYLVLWINFVLAERRVALAINLTLLALMVFNTPLFESNTALITYLITSGLITAFAYIFAHRLAYQQEQLELMASRDPLTQAGNRRSMRRDLMAAVRDQDRSCRPYTLMLLDLDHFKDLNDNHGHDAGDQALRDFAELLRHHVRAGDGLYRFGGEEFVLLFPDTGVEAAERLASTLHQATSGALETPGGLLNFSAGVAVLQPKESMDDWLTRADRALYRAKAAGRGRVEFSAQTGTVDTPGR